jgi:hypothetical protein
MIHYSEYFTEKFASLLMDYDNNFINKFDNWLRFGGFLILDTVRGLERDVMTMKELKDHRTLINKENKKSKEHKYDRERGRGKLKKSDNSKKIGSVDQCGKTSTISVDMGTQTIPINNYYSLLSEVVDDLKWVEFFSEHDSVEVYKNPTYSEVLQYGSHWKVVKSRKTIEKILRDVNSPQSHPIKVETDENEFLIQLSLTSEYDDSNIQRKTQAIIEQKKKEEERKIMLNKRLNEAIEKIKDQRTRDMHNMVTKKEDGKFDHNINQSVMDDAFKNDSDSDVSEPESNSEDDSPSPDYDEHQDSLHLKNIDTEFNTYYMDYESE